MADKIRIFNGNTLKILAAVCMVIDHVGLMFFPSKIIFRIIGRLAFPIFAFMISEGARYTKNKLRYILTMFTLGAICQVVYYFFDYGSLYMCILITFSLSILLIYTLQFVKEGMLASGNAMWLRAMYALFGILVLTAVYYLNRLVQIDYGFFGCVLPAFASLLDFRDINAPEWLKRLDTLPSRIAVFAIGLALLSYFSGTVQYFSILAIPLLLLYSGKRGRFKMKYFFYLFYPLHLVALEAIYMLIRVL